MTGQYVQLNNLNNDDDGHNVHESARRGTPLRLPKRWAVVGGVVTCVLLLFYFTGSKSLYSLHPGGSSVQDDDTASLPDVVEKTDVLGPNEDATRLYFPSVGSSFLPHVASYNIPSTPRPRTPLFIAFTRNNAMLQQVVLSYIAAGWPREDIIIVDNSGTMDANPEGLLSENNPFHLNYALFRRRYGVSILQTPVLLNFPQLMNFFLRTSITEGWQYYFWSHMDVAVLSDEAGVPYKSFYQRVLDVLGDMGIDDVYKESIAQAAKSENWAIKYFSYDWLTLVNVSAWRKIGQWDPFIQYYASDCDAYSRAALNGYTKTDVRAGYIFDLPDVVADVEEKFFPQGSDSESQINSLRYKALLAELNKMTTEKPENNRNKWQGKSHGGHGEPWTYDPDGFQRMWWKTAGFGRELYKEKWGTSECRLDEHGFTLDDMFKHNS